jgi:integrase
VLPRKRWPALQFKEKRAITAEEHRTIVEREPNLEFRAFYELLWEIGGSQTDVATLTAEDFDLDQRVLAYERHKTRTLSRLRFAERVAELLRRLPPKGPLFPKLAIMHEKHRAKEFRRRCQGLGIHGVSLHSYRYAWAERAKVAGYPERFAQEALGQNSKAVHRAYARNAEVTIPSLEEYENRQEERKIIPFPSQPLPNPKVDPPDARPVAERSNETPASALPVPPSAPRSRSAG